MKKTAYASLCSLIVVTFVLIPWKMAHATVGQNACGRIHGTVIFASFNVRGPNDVRIEGDSDATYRLRVKINTLELLYIDDPRIGNLCDNFEKKYPSGSNVDLYLSVDTERYIILPGQPIEANVFMSGGVYLVGSGLAIPWWIWLSWALVVVTIISAASIIIILLRRRNGKK